MFNMKKLIAVTIVSACMLSPLTSACAETITDESPCELPLYYKQYIEECLPIYLNNTDLGMDGDGLTMTYDDWYRSHYVG